MKLPKPGTSIVSTEDLLQPGHDVKDRWRVLSKIGFGGFGEIYRAVDKTTTDLVALKVEKPTKQSLKMEVSVLKALQGTDFVSRFIHAGKSSCYNYLVMELHGPSLADMRRKHPKGFTLSTTLRVGKDILRCLNYLHDADFVHRDVKPANFLTGFKDEKKIYMIDFGLAKQYRTSKGDIKPARKNPGFRGTVRYASLNAHKNIDLGRNDDLWSLFYMLVEFVQGSLPWKGLKDHDAVMELKLKTSPKDLIKAFPAEFESLLSHISLLAFEDAPDYQLLQNALNACQQIRGIRDEDPYDWEQDSLDSIIYPAEPESLSDSPMAQRVHGSLSNDNMDFIKEKCATKLNSHVKRNKKNYIEQNVRSKFESAVIYADDCNNFLQNSKNDHVSNNSQSCNNKLKPTCKSGHQASLENKNTLNVSNNKSYSNVISSSQYAVAEGNTSLPQFTIGEETSVSKVQLSADHSKNINLKFDSNSLLLLKNYLKEIEDEVKKTCLALKSKVSPIAQQQTSQLEWKGTNRNGFQVLEICEKRGRPVRRSVSHPARTPPNVRVRRPAIKGDVPSFFQLGSLFVDSQTPKGLPRCWSCPTISLHIRSHLQPPLKQQASFDESVYEVDVMRNVAAKQISIESIFLSDERRTSLPHISANDTQSEEMLKSNNGLSDLIIKEDYTAEPSKTDFPGFEKNGLAINRSVNSKCESNIYLNVGKNNSFICEQSAMKSNCTQSTKQLKNTLRRSLSMPRNKQSDGQKTFQDLKPSSVPKNPESSKVSDKHHSNHRYQKNILDSFSKGIALNSVPQIMQDISPVFECSSACFIPNHIRSNTDNEENTQFSKDDDRNIYPLGKSSSLSSTDFIREYIGVHNSSIHFCKKEESLSKIFKEVKGENSVLNDFSEYSHSQTSPKKLSFTSDQTINCSALCKGTTMSACKDNMDLLGGDANQKCEENCGQRRCRANPDNKYAKDESELKLNFARRRQRPKSMMSMSQITPQSCDNALINQIDNWHNLGVKSIHSIPQSELMRQDSNDDLNLHQKSTLNTHSEKLPIFYQGQKVYETSTDELPNSPPGDPPHNYCLPSRRIRYHLP